MTLSLRRKHRFIILILAVILPMGFAASIAFRQSAIDAPGSSSLAPHPSNFGPVVWTSDILWPARNVATSLRRDSSGAVAVELRWRDLPASGLLLYWSPGKVSPGADLPNNARLIGAANSGAILPFPDELRGETGTLILYNLLESHISAHSRGLIFQRR